MSHGEGPDQIWAIRRGDGVAAAPKKDYFSDHIRCNLFYRRAGVRRATQKDSRHAIPGRRTGKTGLKDLPRGSQGVRRRRCYHAAAARGWFGSPGQPCWTGGWFVCLPGIMTRGETPKLHPAGESLVGSCLVGINEKGARVEGARADWWRIEGKSVCKTKCPCRTEPRRDAARRIPNSQPSTSL